MVATLTRCGVKGLRGLREFKSPAQKPKETMDVGVIKPASYM
jgi:hypothetical protein